MVYSFSSHGSPFLKNQIITIHDLICLNYPKQHKFQYYYFKYILPSIIRSSKRIVVISEFTKREVVKHYNICEENIEVIYNGTNIIEYIPNDVTEKQFCDLTKGKPFFITVGATYQHKNILNLLKAVMAFDRKDVLFFIIGKPNQYGIEMREFAKANNLTNVIFLDYISESLLGKLYTEAICNIYVSLYEGFGFPPLEAASVGTISLVSDIPVMKEIFGNTMVYTNPESPAEIAEKIKKISEGVINPKVSEQDRDYLLSKYSWNNTTNHILTTIESLNVNHS